MATSADLKSTVAKIIQSLNSKNTDVVTNSLTKARSLTDVGIDHHSSSDKIHEEFFACHYVVILENLLDLLSVDWISQIPRPQQSELIDGLFFNGRPDLALVTLSSYIQNDNPKGYKLNKCVKLIEDILQQHLLSKMVWTRCRPTRHRVCSCSKQAQVQLCFECHGLITCLVSLPERITNRLGKQTSDLFFPQKFVPFVCQEIESTLRMIHDKTQEGEEVSSLFISHLIGRLCFMGPGYTAMVWSSLLENLSVLSQCDTVWSKLTYDIVSGVPDSLIENLVLIIIKQSPSYHTVSRFFRNLVLTNQKLQYLITNKFIFLKTFESSKVPQNIIGYLTDSESRCQLYIKTYRQLLDVWGDKSSIKHTSYEQHKYLTKCLLLCTAFMGPKKATEVCDEFTVTLMSAIQHHIESPVEKMRILGMIVAESMTRKLKPTGDHLKFEYNDSDEIEKLKQLLIVPTTPASEKRKDIGVNLAKEKKATPSNPKNETISVSVSQSENAVHEEELDSDDDLEPFDLSNDTTDDAHKAPVYLRDCMEGLISTDDPRQVDRCLSCAETLIRQNMESLQEIAVEFIKLLLHLSNDFSIDQFVLKRHRSMVALCLLSPIPVADYLTDQFYERNYSIRQRMDILDVLVSAAQELSGPTTEACTMVTDVSPSNKNSTEDKDQGTDWRDVVQERIDSKTRRFSKGRSRPEPEGKPNRFASVAGHFFFPLLNNFYNKDKTIDREDSLVIGKLIFSLGVIMYSAINSPIASRMGGSLMEFLWIQRYHGEVYVRRAVLFAIAMTFLATPSFDLFGSLQFEVLEIKKWLEEIMMKDEDEKCRQLSTQAGHILQTAFKMRNQ